MLKAIDAFEFKEIVSINKDKLYPNELLFLKRTIELLGLLSVKLSDKCEKTILDNYDKFTENGRVAWFYQSFDKTEMSPILTTFFLKNIFDNLIIQKTSPYQRDFLFRSMWHESRRDLMKQVLLESLNDSNGEKRMLALYFLRIFPDEDVIEACLEIYSSKKKGIGERERAKSNLTGFLQAPNLSEAKKNRIRRHLKN